MESFNYLVGLTGIVIALALTEVASGLSRLLRHGLTRSDPLIIVRAALVVVILVGMWFDIWGVRSFPGLYSFPFFLLLFVELLLLYMVAAFSVPTDVRRESYEPANDLFWRIFTAHQVAFSVLATIFQLYFRPLLKVIAFLSAEILIPFAVGILLSIRRERWLHACGILLLFALYFYGYSRGHIG